jgi:hypothetical protein
MHRSVDLTRGEMMMQARQMVDETFSRLFLNTPQAAVCLLPRTRTTEHGQNGATEHIV